MKKDIYSRFYSCIHDLIQHSTVLEMEGIPHHINVNCLEHSVFVAYVSFRISLFLKLDFEASARGGLLHDLFLYDWKKTKTHKKYHLFSHPTTALDNAMGICDLTEIEKDIIQKHMWPLTIKPPRYMESFVVSLADKFCALIEMLFIYKLMNIRKRLAFA